MKFDIVCVEDRRRWRETRARNARAGSTRSIIIAYGIHVWLHLSIRAGKLIRANQIAYPLLPRLPTLSSSSPQHPISPRLFCDARLEPRPSILALLLARRVLSEFLTRSVMQKQDAGRRLTRVLFATPARCPRNVLCAYHFIFKNNECFEQWKIAVNFEGESSSNRLYNRSLKDFYKEKLV